MDRLHGQDAQAAGFGARVRPQLTGFLERLDVENRGLGLPQTFELVLGDDAELGRFFSPGIDLDFRAGAFPAAGPSIPRARATLKRGLRRFFDQAQNVLLLIAIPGPPCRGRCLPARHRDASRSRRTRAARIYVVAVDRFRNPGDRRDVANFD